jgi:transcriptional antiterminator NusG
MISSSNESFSTSANGTDDDEAYPKAWYVAYVQMNCEKKTEKKLQSLGFETFLPVQSEIHLWSDINNKIDRIVIPMMLFVKLDRRQLNEIRNLSYIYNILTAPGEKQPAVVPDEQIEKFKFMLHASDSPVSLECTDIQKGESVRVARGVLKGFEGVVCTISNNTMIGLYIDCLGFACVTIKKEDLEYILDH